MIICAENNQLKLAGRIEKNFEYSHTTLDEDIYMTTISVMRYSGNIDYIPVLATASLLRYKYFMIGDVVMVTGQFRSYNLYEDGKSKLSLSAFAKQISLCDDDYCNINKIFLNGYICKPPVVRVTPLRRNICDVLFAVNRARRKTDYIPLIFWGNNAELAGALQVGDNLQILGRVQSRIYNKKLDDYTTIEKTAYEVSVNEFNFTKGENTDEN